MLTLNLPQSSTLPFRVLCLGAHSDDIEIGCGGTILRLLGSHPNCEISWVVLSSNQERGREARDSAERFLVNAKAKEIIVERFRDGFFPFDGPKIKEFFEGLKRVSPDMILTHRSKDAHQDHRQVAELTWNTFRDHFILEYEIPKYDGDLGQPSVFMPLAAEVSQKKVGYLIDVFASQRSKNWFARDTFLSLMRLRGMECNAPSGYAEAFYCRKLAL